MDSTRPETQAAAIAASRNHQSILVRDLTLEASIGVHSHEQKRTQPILINIEVEIAESRAPMSGAIADAYCYERLIERITSLVGSRHYNLVETLAEDIAGTALNHPLAGNARVRVEKLSAIENAGGVGVEILRFKTA